MSGALEHAIFEIVEIAVLILELLAVAIVVSAVLLGMGRYLKHVVTARALEKERFDAYRTTLARALLLGLEILVAADVVRTVVLEPTAEGVLVLGLLVLIRIVLGWSLIVEMEGHWPWQGKNEEPPAAEG
jgi:uncharacterized membrane protein